MIPEYLTDNPFPEGDEWNREQGPIVVVDGRVFIVRKLNKRITGHMAYVVGVNQSEFDKLCTLLTANIVQFYEMRVDDVSSLAKVNPVQLGIQWNTKLASLDFVERIPDLKALVLIDNKKVTSLAPLSQLHSLEVFEYSGGMWNTQTAETLEPLAHIRSLRHLALTSFRVLEGGLYPLAALKELKELEVSNQFPTEEYAFLSVALPNTSCYLFSPYVKLNHPFDDGRDLMVTGKRKPFLSSKRDGARIKEYVARFKRMQEEYAAGV